MAFKLLYPSVKEGIIIPENLNSKGTAAKDSALSIDTDFVSLTTASTKT